MLRGLLLAYFWWVGSFVHNTATCEKVNNSYRSTVNVKGQSNTSCKLQKVYNTILVSFHKRIVHLMVHLVYFRFSFVHKLKIFILLLHDSNYSEQPKQAIPPCHVIL